MSPVDLPRGFGAYVANLGIKDLTDDFTVVASEVPCVSSALFTRSRFAGPSVVVSRRNAADRQLQAVVVVSKNANVATGAEGLANAEELCEAVARSVGVAPHDVLVTSTGVIGRQYPMERIRNHLAPYGAASDSSTGCLLPLESRDAFDVASAMMTTDTHPKVASASVGGAARIVGVAKGVGMIEPDMATMLSFIFTDAQIEADTLDRAFRSIVDETFNSLSVDTDTSTSDTAAILANGLAGEVDLVEFESALRSVCLDLTRQLARDGEGATKLLVVEVDSARDNTQAKRVAKSILNSPLVKTAVHGADPNWGRVAMAIGKCSDDTDINESKVRIGFGSEEVYPAQVDDNGLAELEKYLKGDEVLISVDLGIADGTARVYGCDLSDGYVRINADYTT